MSRTSIRMFMSLLAFGCLCSTFWQFQFPDFSFALYPLAYLLLITAVGSCFLSFCFRNNTRPYMNLSDIFLFSIAAYYIIRYNFGEQLAQWRIILWVEILILWTLLRWLLSNRMLTSENISWVIVTTGVLQSVWGILQLYDFCPSNHVGYDITGSFLNPGPYSGYVGLAFPVALHLFLKHKNCKHWLALVAMLSMFCILPAGMSRSAWVGSIIASLWVVFYEKGLFRYWHSRKRIFIVSFLIILIIGIIGGVLIFNLKKDSVYGRLFIWENVCSAIAERPITGYGSCSFSSVYANFQSAKFKSGDYSDRDERVAGNPEYAFNEYLQMGLEGGCIILILFVALIFVCIKQGLRQKQYGLCGSLLSFLLFAFTSYPLQYPAFWVVLCFILVGMTNPVSMNIKNNHNHNVITMIMCVLSAAVCHVLPSPKKQIETWEKCRILQSTGGKRLAMEGYELLYPSLKHCPQFILEYAQCLAELASYEKSNQLYERYLKLQCNSLVYTMIGQNYLHMDRYRDAERYFLKSVFFLPNRIYPYYLLAKLYANPKSLQPDKFKEVAYKVLYKKPKVHSEAIDEMRDEIQRISQKCNIAL